VLVDSTRLRDHPLTIGVARTMPGLAEALETMLPRERRRLWVPEALAYRGRPGAPAGMLVVDVELLELVELPAAPPAQASAAAVTTISGLSSELLEAGTGSRHPGPDSLVTVHFTGWTASGELHDSSLTRGQPTTVRVSELIPGWQEGLQLMVEGESRRLWLPAELAFAGKPDKPVGPMVYDLELLAISD
jgi:FKBP-type peptidyl-prolyl cis-trans isomerase